MPKVLVILLVLGAAFGFFEVFSAFANSNAADAGTVGSMGVATVVIAGGTLLVANAVERLREATVKIHSIERTERLQRDLASGNPELVARAQEAIGPRP